MCQKDSPKFVKLNPVEPPNMKMKICKFTNFVNFCDFMLLKLIIIAFLAIFSGILHGSILRILGCPFDTMSVHPMSKYADIFLKIEDTFILKNIGYN